jgi:SAM-dependent methyltransferase
MVKPPFLPFDFPRPEPWPSPPERSWLQRLLFRRVQKTVLAAATDLSFSPGRIVDLGCGGGRTLEHLGRLYPNAELIGVEVSPGMVEAARRHHRDPRFRFEVAPADALPIETASADLAVSVLAARRWGDLVAALRETGRVLRRGGWFVLADLQPAGIYRALRLVAGPIAGPPALSGLQLRAAFAAGGVFVIDQRSLRGTGRAVLLTVGRRTA